MQNKWLIILGLWVAFVGFCFYYVDKGISAMMIILMVIGIAMVIWFFVSNALEAKHRKEIK